MHELRVFEVDHPATQQWKRELLQRNHIAIPESVTYTPVDFERQSLPAQLGDAGFNFQAPAFFAWLGVVPYLTLEAFRATLSFVCAQRAWKRPDSGLRATTLRSSARSNGWRTTHWRRG